MQPVTPMKLGRYEIVDELGKGAMGVVYLARDPLIGRLVALKTFRISYSVQDQEMEQFRVRFMREAQSAGILTHPNIVTIHDVVEDTGDGLAFIAMEYVRGTNLKLLLQGEQPLSLRFVLDIVTQVADALDYAHSNRVIHRDVKPANILITAENRVKITDFGIARLDSSNLTQEGQMLGTPNYMSPEQILGKEVDWRADLFSLGVVVYEMLTRHKPFQGENLTVVSHRIVYDPFTPPREYASELPPGMEKILTRALEKEPARRFQRARDLVDELRRAVAPAGDDLNETQSLAASPLGPPPPALATAARPGRAASGPSSPPATVAGGLNETLATAAPAPRRPALGRWLAIGGILAVVAILAGASVKLWQRWSPPVPVQQTAAGDAMRRVQVAKLMEEGNREMRRAEFERAVALYRQAEQLDPENQQLRNLRKMAELEIPAYKDLLSQEKAIAANLAGAQRALAAGKDDQAATLASLVLGLEPDNAEARAILAKAQQGQSRAAKQRTAPGQPRVREETATTAASEGPAPELAEPAAAEAGTATIHLHFVSELPEGALIVWDRRQGVDTEIFRDTFSRGGILQRFFHKPEPYEITRTLNVTAGTAELIVHVAPSGVGALRRQRRGNFPEGSTRNLEIHLSKSAQLTVSLD
jgi:tRNA A-37 threonylcarbamoyl transferase component Bud32